MDARRRTRIVFLAIVTVVSLQGTRDSFAGERVEFSYFQNLSHAQKQTFQFRMTYWESSGLVQLLPLVLHADTETPQLAVFKEFRHSTREEMYRSDDLYSPKAVALRLVPSAGIDDVESLISAVAQLPEYVDGGDTPGQLAIGLVVKEEGGPKGFESILTHVEGGAFFNKLWPLFRGNTDARYAIQEFACTTGMFDRTLPIEVTTRSSVTISDMHLDPVTGHSRMRATVRNVSSRAFPSPLTLMLDFRDETEVANKDGDSCLPVRGEWSARPGQDYVSAKVALAPESEHVFELELVHGRQGPDEPIFHVLAGPGTL